VIDRREEPAAFGSPHYHILRTLVAALCPWIARIAAIASLAWGPRWAGRSTIRERSPHRADVLVGADGIHSTVRRILFGPERPHFTGCMCYRGLVPAVRLAHL